MCMYIQFNITCLPYTVYALYIYIYIYIFFMLYVCIPYILYTLYMYNICI